MLADNLTGQYVSDTFRKILQLSDNGNYVTDGTGSIVNILPITASHVVGGTSGVTINNNTNNNLITATGLSGTLNGESNLTFDGSTLTVVGNVLANSFTGSLFGTSSWSVSSSVAITSSFATSASFSTTARTSSAAVITTTTPSSGPWYPTFVVGTSGNYPLIVNAPFSYNQVTNVLTVTSSYASQSLSSSYAVTASYSLNTQAGGLNRNIQYNGNGILAGENSFNYKTGGSESERILEFTNGINSAPDRSPYKSGINLISNANAASSTFNFVNTVSVSKKSSEVAFIVDLNDFVIGAVCQYTIFDPLNTVNSVRTGTLQISFLDWGNTLLNDFNNGGIGLCEWRFVQFTSDQSSILNCTRILVNNYNGSGHDIKLIINVTTFVSK